MKKTIISLLAAVAALALASCAKEEPYVDPTNGPSKEKLIVSFALDLGNKMTKATPETTGLDDASGEFQLYAAVFSKSGGELLPASLIGGAGYKPVGSVSDKSASLTLTLSRNQDYRVVFFAMHADAYDVQFADGNVAKFSFKRNLKANDASLDAFWATVDVTAASASYNVTMKRPFAQLNVLAKSTDVPQGQEAFSSTMSVVAPVSFDMYAGAAGTETEEIVFASNAIKAEAFGGYKTTHTWVGMNYVLVPENGKVDVTSFQESGMTSAVNIGLVPVKVNGRTNMVGEVYSLTDFHFNVQINPGFGDEQEHTGNGGGGGENINYHFGVGYNQEKGIYKGDDQNRINFKGSVDAKINSVISAGFSVNGARTRQEYANDAAIQHAYRMNPYMTPYNSEGVLNEKPGNYQALGTTSSYQFSDQANPLLVMQSTNKQRETWRVLGNFYLKFDIIKGLDFKTTFSPSYTNYREGYFEGYKNPDTDNFYDTSLTTNATNLTNNRSFSWTWDNIINYNTTIADDHSLGLMALFSSQASNTEKSYWAATEVMDGTDWWNMGTGTYNADDSYTSYTENSMISYAFRLNYSYKSRYLLTATVRRDGSSKFTKDNRWGTFPSVALAWRASEEAFLQKVNWLSNLKLRLSYGVTGNNDGIGNYATQQSVSGPVFYPFGPDYLNGFYPSSIVNKDLKWETSTEYNAGIDFGFFGGRINGSVDVYQKTSKDLLYSVALPLESGGGTMVTNIGSVRNTGVEVALTTVNVETKDWHWETTFTFAANKNKVREINGTGDRVLSSGITTGSLFVGSSVNNTYAYEWGGVVTDRDMTVPNNAAATNAGLTPGSTMKEYDYYYKVYGLTEGQPYVIDQNGDGNIDQDDRVIKSMDPKWTGSFTSNLTWKNWDFSFSLYAKVGYKVYSSFLTSDILGLNDRGRQKLAMDWYIPAGTLLDCDGVNEDGTYINPKYQEVTHYGGYPFPNNGGSNSGVGRQADYWNVAKGISDASFLKVKNITLGYTFEKNFLNKFGCKHLRLYATVTNPFVITSYKGFDPEWAGAGVKQDGPSTINYQVGASIKF